MAYPSNRRDKKPKPVITDMSDAMIASYGDELADLDRQIKDLQEAKGGVYENVREHHGKKAAKALKIAVSVHGLTSEKRAEAEEIDTEAQRMLAIIERGTVVATHVARGARADEPAHDADGVIIETTEPAPSPSGDVAAASEGDVRAVAAGSLAHEHEPDAPPSPRTNAPASGEGGADAPVLSANQSRPLVEAGEAHAPHQGDDMVGSPFAGTGRDDDRHPISTPDKSAASGLAAAPVVPFKASGKPLRPYCQPDASGVCASPGGKQHCFRCEQLHRVGGEFPTVQHDGVVN